MYGKLFESTFTGSLVGSGPDVFAVWAYVIAHAKPPGEVELNPKLLAMVLGASEASVRAAIDKLCAPDEASRSKDEGGCRLVKTGEYLYRVPTWSKYRSIKNDEERREYNRIKKRESRARQGHVKLDVNDSQRLSAKSAQAEAEADAEASKTPLPPEGEVTPKPSKPKPEYPPEPTDARALQAYRDWREHKKAKFTPIVAMKTRKRLDEWGVDRFVAAVDYSITNAYAGLFEPPRVNGQTHSRISGLRPQDEEMWRERLRSDDLDLVKLARKTLMEHGVTV